MKATEINKGLKLPKVHTPESKPTMLHGMMSEMFRSVIDEASEASVAVRGSPYADQLIKKLHTNLDISHKLPWEEQDKIQWREIKEVTPNYVLIAGTTGTAAVKWTGYQYVVYMSTAEGIVRGESESINKLMNDIKQGIGKPTKFFQPKAVKTPSSYDSFSSRYGKEMKPELVRTKRQIARDPDPRTVKGVLPKQGASNDNLNRLQARLKPLIVRYLTTALADIKGAAAIALKNDAYDVAGRKLNLAKELSAWIVRAEGDATEQQQDRLKRDLNSKIYNAIVMTAGYYYPDSTGEITQNGARLRPNSSNGVDRVVDDIAAGDNQKLTAVMAYLKQSFLHG